jgi:hypothetical protein
MCVVVAKVHRGLYRSVAEVGYMFDSSGRNSSCSLPALNLILGSNGVFLLFFFNSKLKKYYGPCDKTVEQLDKLLHLNIFLLPKMEVIISSGTRVQNLIP